MEDNIRDCGEMSKLLSDRSKSGVKTFVESILRELFIDYWKTEQHYHYQNFVEHLYQTFKHLTNNIINRMNDPAYTWLLALVYV